MEIQAFFNSHAIFRYEEFAQWRNEQGTFDKKSIRKALYYYTRTGRVQNLRRGLYAAKMPGTPYNSIDPYLLAGKASKDSVLTYHTALELHGWAHTVFPTFTFSTTQKVKPFEIEGHFYNPVAAPLALQRKNEILYGTQTMERQGQMVRVTDLARTYVDVLDRIELSGGWEEVVRAINNIAVLNVESVIDYCLMLDNRILAAKVGYFLEQREGAFAVSEKLLKLLKQKIPSTVQSVIMNNEKGKLIKNWNLILPLSVLNQTWEEPDYDV